mmetsp:Transcript_51287/g.100711  ORF Transcript_51287/g.100711 Transcript_51287/m.100711 type:complete len:114 (+) Transcript_51287:1469-1810(+)
MKPHRPPPLLPAPLNESLSRAPNVCRFPRKETAGSPTLVLREQTIKSTDSEQKQSIVRPTTPFCYTFLHGLTTKLRETVDKQAGSRSHFFDTKDQPPKRKKKRADKDQRRRNT